MRLSDYRKNMMERYWRDLAERHSSVAGMAREAGVTGAYVYASLARYGVDTPKRGK